MPTAVQDTLDSAELPRKLWTRDECHVLADAGLLDWQRVELIEGELLNKMGKNQRHVLAVSRLLRWLMKAFGETHVLQEAPIDVGPGRNTVSEPEPDLCVTIPEADSFEVNRPAAADIGLLVEVADSSLKVDLNIKASLYARAEIVEYWVLDIPGRRMIVHREPRDGRYQSVQAYDETESVSPLAAPHSSAPVSDFLT